MVEINNTPVKLNQIICIGFLNDRGNYEVLSGRLYLYNDKFIHIDHSYNFQELEDTTRIRRDKIKYCKVTMDNMWR